MAHIRPSPPQPPLLPCDKDDASPRLSQLLQTLADSDPAAPRRRRHAFHSGPLLRRQHPRPCGQGVCLQRRCRLREHQALNPQGNKT